MGPQCLTVSPITFALYDLLSGYLVFSSLRLSTSLASGIAFRADVNVMSSSSNKRQIGRNQPQMIRKSTPRQTDIMETSSQMRDVQQRHIKQSIDERVHTSPNLTPFGRPDVTADGATSVSTGGFHQPLLWHDGNHRKSLNLFHLPYRDVSEAGKW